jgi:hypothetical protein
MLAHLRTEAYPLYASPQYPPAPRTAAHAAALSFERNVELIETAKRTSLPPEGESHSSGMGVASGFSRKAASGAGPSSDRSNHEVKDV